MSQNRIQSCSDAGSCLSVFLQGSICPASLQTLDVSAQETAEQKEVRLVTEAGSNALWYAPATSWYWNSMFILLGTCRDIR